MVSSMDGEAMEFVRLSLGDATGIALTKQFNNMADAERYATAYLGREWGDSREISVATFYTQNAGEWEFHSEMEF